MIHIYADYKWSILNIIPTLDEIFNSHFEEQHKSYSLFVLHEQNCVTTCTGLH